MMKAIRILSLILALLMLAAPLAACNDDDTPDNEGGGSTTPPPADENVELQVVTKSVANYDIVIDYNASQAVKDAVAAMTVAFKTYLGCDITVRYIGSDDPSSEKVADNEILIGETPREESKRAMEDVRANDYKIAVDGKKIVIVAGNDEKLFTAVGRFNTTFVYEQGNKAAATEGVKMDLKVDSTTAKTLCDVGKYSFSKTVLCGARIDSYAIIVPSASEIAVDYAGFASDIQKHLTKNAGYNLGVHQDKHVKKANYKILVGDTSFTDESLVDSLKSNEYYIALNKTADGAVFTILFGADAKDAALKAFKEIFPASADPIEIKLADGFVKTNKQ